MHYEELKPVHYKGLWKLFVATESRWQTLSKKEFIEILSQREGWVIIDDTKAVGCLMLGDYYPNSDITINLMVYPEYYDKWMSRKLIKDVTNRVFHELRLPRMSAYSIPGINDQIEDLLIRLGFNYEGTKRNTFWCNGEYKDHKLFGMIKEECRWI